MFHFKIATSTPLEEKKLFIIFGPVRPSFHPSVSPFVGQLVFVIKVAQENPTSLQRVFLFITMVASSGVGFSLTVRAAPHECLIRTSQP